MNLVELSSINWNFLGFIFLPKSNIKNPLLPVSSTSLSGEPSPSTSPALPTVAPNWTPPSSGCPTILTWVLFALSNKLFIVLGEGELLLPFKLFSTMWLAKLKLTVDDPAFCNNSPLLPTVLVIKLLIFRLTFLITFWGITIIECL